MIKSHRKEKYIFRLYKLSKRKIDDFKQRTNGLVYEIKPLRNVQGRFTIVINLDKTQLYMKYGPEILQFIKDHKLSKKSYGIWASLLTERDNDGLHLPVYVIQFYKQLEGSIDFSFISG